MSKRKSDVVEMNSDCDDTSHPAPKKAKGRADMTTSSNATAPKTTTADRKLAIQAEELAAFDAAVSSDNFEIYDDCNEIRRKIRLLQKEPGFKVTRWLREDLGGINSNSLGRFMKASGPSGGAENGTYPAAYVYFERKRIMEGKKKTAKRERNEATMPMGMPLQDRRRQWVVVGTGLTR